MKLINLHWRWSVPVSAAVLATSASLKLLNVLGWRLGMLDRYMSHVIPPDLLLLGAGLEFAACFSLLLNLNRGTKLLLLSSLGVSLLAFRLLAFGTLWVNDCGCFGSLSWLSVEFGKVVNVFAALFVVYLCLLYPGFLYYNRFSKEEVDL